MKENLLRDNICLRVTRDQTNQERISEYRESRSQAVLAQEIDRRDIEESVHAN